LLLQGAELDNNRLYRKFITLTQKSDITEETVRLDSHLKALSDLLRAAEPVGKRIEFLCKRRNEKSTPSARNRMMSRYDMRREGQRRGRKNARTSAEYRVIMSDDTDTTPFTLHAEEYCSFFGSFGAGKTTLSRQILERTPDLRLSISYTTRAPRSGEIDGQDYHFIDEARFIALRTAGAFAEWAQVHNFLYGTARAPLDAALASGQDSLLDIDVQGARQMKASYPEAIAVFVLPPPGLN
jgi:ABC-type glutathione transport system ATPase component